MRLLKDRKRPLKRVTVRNDFVVRVCQECGLPNEYLAKRFIGHSTRLFPSHSMGRLTRTYDLLGALSVAGAFVCLLVGRVLNFQLSIVPGSHLERVAAKAEIWDWAHRFLLVGAVLLIPAALALRRKLLATAPLLVDIATAITIFGAALTVGQLALDYAILAAAQFTPPDQAVVDRLRAMPFVEHTFYTIPTLSVLSHLLIAAVFVMHGRGWQYFAALVLLGVFAMFFGSMLGPIGVRVAMAIATLGYLGAAWKIALGERSETPAAV
jgi:hypothetical protein